MDDLRYPIGRFSFPGEVSESQRADWLRDIAAAPALLRQAVAGLTEEQLDVPYRPGGWTVRQMVHHLADSHMQSFIRFKLALTEAAPLIKAYNQERWAETPDSLQAPIAVSLDLFSALHTRWSVLLQAMPPADFARTIQHPERGIMPLIRLLGTYAHHGKHHTAQINALRDRMGWR